MTRYINCPDDLITPRETTVAGFLAQALKKTEMATPYTEDAATFRQALQRTEDINALDTLLDDPEFRPGLIAAAGFSQKAAKYMTKGELDNAIKTVFVTLRERGDETLRVAVADRLLLTKGETLGGTMKNWIGAQAGLKLTSALIAALPPGEEADIKKSDTGKVRRISWDDRLLLFDVKVSIVGGSNVDVVLLDTSRAATLPELLALPEAYLACGELKGGVDPAGADEHWKTTRGALDRIRREFAKRGYSPAIFFVGAAIVTRMAGEIYNDLHEGGLLAHAANLTKSEQLQDLAEWLIAL